MMTKNTFFIYLLAFLFFASCSSATPSDGDDVDDGDTFSGYTFEDPLAAITYALMGVSDDGTARAGADPAAFITSDGEVRLIFTGPDGSLASALSPDGNTFTVDEDFASPFALVGIAQPTIVENPTGGYRMFARSGTEVYSATSEDGTTWTQEDGIRFDVADMELASTTGPSVVPLSDGSYRMYFSPETTGCSTEGVSNNIYSATSVDQLTWVADDGTRVGDEVDSRCKNKPTAIVESDGSITLFYHVYSLTGSDDTYQGMVFYSNSTDGLTFTTQTSTELGLTSPTSGGLTEASDPYILEMEDGSVKLYFDVFYAPDGDEIYVSSGERN